MIIFLKDFYVVSYDSFGLSMTFAVRLVAIHHTSSYEIGIAQLKERRTRDQKATDPIPGSSGVII